MNKQTTRNTNLPSSGDFPDPVPLHLTENARIVLAHRYLKKDEAGNLVETPEQLFHRVAHAVASIEARYGADPPAVALWQRRFYNLMASLRFLPNSPTLMNAGRKMGMLSACFVLDLPDSIDGIFDAVKYTALIQKAGGGTGFTFDALRPTGDFISSSGGKTSGPISFWKVLSETTNAIQQGAFRRGANMGMLTISHPDILKFLHAKTDLDAFTNYNTSVKIPDQWMARLDDDPHQPHIVVNPRTRRKYYLPRTLDIWSYQLADLTEVPDSPDENRSLLHDRPNAFWTLAQLWDEIIRNAHATGEPGLAFIDRINADNMTPHLGRIEATNPCGEQPLLPYEACNLGSINLAKFIAPQPTPSGRHYADETGVESLARFNLDALADTIRLAHRFLDNIVDLNHYHIDRIDRMCKGNRKVGLGLMGFADALFLLQLPYDDPAARDLGREIMHFLNDHAHHASEQLAHERGSFPFWPGSRWNTELHRPQRNAATTTIAPTGTLSLLADCSGGIEPIFSVVYQRNVLSGTHLLEVNPVFRQCAHDRSFYSDSLLQHIAQAGSLQPFPEIPDDIKRLFRCALEIDPEDHVRMQAAFQQHCDAAISKTINFPENAPIDRVARVFRLAHQLGCKGITIYRYGSRPSQPMAHARDAVVHPMGLPKSTPSASSGPAASATQFLKNREKNTKQYLFIGQSPLANEQTSVKITTGTETTGQACPRPFGGTENELSREGARSKSVKCPACGDDLAFTETCVTCYGCGYAQC